MSSHLCLENRLSVWAGGSHQGWWLLHRGPQMGLGPVPQCRVRRGPRDVLLCYGHGPINWPG